MAERTIEMLAPEAYQAKAAAVFTRLARDLRGLLPAARIEHVGASSIPGAVSKGDLDICVVVPAAEHASAVSALQRAGFQVKNDTLRTDALCMLIAPMDDYDAAVQIVSEGSTFEFFMRFRDLLTQNPELVTRYNALKVRFAPLGPSIYREAKASFIQSVLHESAQ